MDDLYYYKHAFRCYKSDVWDPQGIGTYSYIYTCLGSVFFTHYWPKSEHSLRTTYTTDPSETFTQHCMMYKEFAIVTFPLCESF